MRSMLLILSCVLLCSTLNTSCAPKPPDVPVCEHLSQRLAKDAITGHMILKPSPTCMEKINEAECGHCTYIISGKEIFIGEKDTSFFNGKSWSVLRSQSILVPAKESYAPIATYMINACKKMNCDDDVNRFRVKIGTLSGAVEEK